MLYNLTSFSKFTDTFKNSHPEVFLKILQNMFVEISFLIKLQAGNLKLSEAATGDVQ